MLGVGTAAIATLSALLAVAAVDPSQGRDFFVGHTGWNGLSRLAGLARDLNCNVEMRRTLDWSTLDGQDVLFVLHPETALDPDSAMAYLTAGGRMIVADDYGEAGALFARLGIVRTTGPAPDGTTLYRGNPQLPVATPQRATVLGRAATELVGNHSAYFRSALPATYAFAPGAGLLIEGTLGRGRFVAISDPSIFINNMLELAGNRDLLARMLIDLCRPQRDRLLLLYGPLAQRGKPPAVLTGAPSDGLGGDLVEQANRSLGSANLRIHETLRRKGGEGLDVIALSGLLFCLGALALLLRYLPMPVPPQDETFAQPPRPPDAGLHASIARYASGAGQAVGWGYVYPATLLREEVLARLQPFASEIAGAEPPTSEQLSARITDAVSPRAGTIAATLLREFRKLDRGRTALSNHPSDAHIPARTLHRWYDLAVELFAELDAAKMKTRTPRNAPGNS